MTLVNEDTILVRDALLVQNLTGVAGSAPTGYSQFYYDGIAEKLTVTNGETHRVSFANTAFLSGITGVAGINSTGPTEVTWHPGSVKTQLDTSVSESGGRIILGAEITYQIHVDVAYTIINGSVDQSVITYLSVDNGATVLPDSQCYSQITPNTISSASLKYIYTNTTPGTALSIWAIAMIDEPGLDIAAIDNSVRAVLDEIY